MAPTPITTYRFPRRLLDRIDAVRGRESRTSWLIRAAEAQLGSATFGGVRVISDSRVPADQVLLVAPLQRDVPGMFHAGRSA